MEFQNGQYISAYTANDTLFEGKVYTRKDGTKVCLREDKKWLPIDKLKMIKIIESEIDATDIQSLIDDDIGKCDMDKIGKLDDGALEKLGQSREDELIHSGIKMDKGAYSQGFISKVKASKVADDANAGNISTSAALEKYKQSKDIDIEQRINQTLKESLLDNVEPLKEKVCEDGHCEGPLCVDEYMDYEVDPQDPPETKKEDKKELKENIYDDLDTEMAYSTDSSIDFDFDPDDEDFVEGDDIFDDEFDDEDLSEDNQDWEAIEDAVQDFSFDDEFDDIYNDKTLAESKKNMGYDSQKDKDYDDALDKMEKEGKELPDSKIKEVGPGPLDHLARSAGWDYGELVTQDEDDILCGDDEMHYAYLEHFNGPKNEKTFAAWKKGYESFIKHFLELDESSNEVLKRMKAQITEQVETEFTEAIDKYVEECEKLVEKELVASLYKTFNIQTKMDEQLDTASQIDLLKEAVIKQRLDEVSTSGIFQVCKALFPTVKSFLGGGNRPDFNKSPQKVQLVNPKVEFPQLEQAKQWCAKHVGELLNSAQAFVIRQLKVAPNQPAQQIGGLVMGAHR